MTAEQKLAWLEKNCYYLEHRVGNENPKNAYWPQEEGDYSSIPEMCGLSLSDYIEAQQ